MIPHRISKGHPFTLSSFQLLLNSLFKVLDFPHGNLFAIPVSRTVFAWWSLPPDKRCTSKQPDSKEIASGFENLAAMRPRTHFGQQPRVKGLAAESVPARSLLNATFPHALARRGFGAGFSRFTARY
ncbi:hypothetical protein JTE90_005344 [Oedothorax gibbosus]|uniref:Uncharacterized protein n=1 Tax=Oedothorax gibbosus TaxID=931172 RepID=A0AAV6TKE4_9ARAC|nr:hypothetical protein JTE90_005344 [Oedothorax gibbosus]